MKTIPKHAEPRSPEFVRGARHAALVAELFESSSVHDHRLGDCILSKMNLRKGAPRENKRKLERPDEAWKRGFLTALAQMLYRTKDGTSARRIFADFRVDMGGVKLSTMDLRTLREAGIPVPYKPRRRQG